MTALDYIADAVRNPLSALLVSGERALAAEFPPDSQARLVLGAIGSGERTYTKIQQAAGSMAQATLNRALHLLTDKRIVQASTPLSTIHPGKSDTPSPTLTCDSGSHSLARICRRSSAAGVIWSRRGSRASWTAWRGTAIEPVIREGLRRVSDQLPGSPHVIGSYWTRTNDPEIDLIGADREPVARRITFVGSIKWRDSQPFDERDLADLISHRSQLPGADESTALVAVSRSGSRVTSARAIGPEELLAAWHR